MTLLLGVYCITSMGFFQEVHWLITCLATFFFGGDNTHLQCLQRALLDNRFASSRIKGFAMVPDDALIKWTNLVRHPLDLVWLYASNLFKDSFSLRRPLD